MSVLASLGIFFSYVRIFLKLLMLMLNGLRNSRRFNEVELSNQYAYDIETYEENSRKY